MEKILVGYLIDGKHSGIDKYLLNVLKMVSSKQIHFDFLTIYKNEKLEQYLRTYEANLYEIPSLKHPVEQYKKVKQLVQKNNYTIAYFNISEAFNSVAIKAARDCGIKKIIVHSHSAGIDSHNPIKRMVRFALHCIGKQFLTYWATDFFACSKKAGQWMFPNSIISGRRLQLVQNAIDADRFAYNEEVRIRVRKELGLEKAFVVGHIGNFCYQKNIEFLIEIIRELVAIKSNAVLLSVGVGPDREMAEKLVCKYGLQNHVYFLGQRDDVPDLLQAMDLFLLPSRFEGLPIVGIEAQVAGLRTILSSTISEEVKLSENCIFVDIHASAKQWAKKIKENAVYKRVYVQELKSSYCFDIKEQKNLLRSLFQTKNLEEKN